jgi:hypothetical protein
VPLIEGEQACCAVPVGEHHVGRVRDSDVVAVVRVPVDDIQGRRVVGRGPFRQFICFGGHVGRELACGCGTGPGEQHVIALGGGHRRDDQQSVSAGNDRGDRLVLGDAQSLGGEDSVTLQVCDNGSGFDPAAGSDGGLGLRAMRERAGELGGSLSIVSGAEGTVVRGVFPVRVSS